MDRDREERAGPDYRAKARSVHLGYCGAQETFHVGRLMSVGGVRIDNACRPVWARWWWSQRISMVTW